jgi:hypothetical protein
MKVEEVREHLERLGVEDLQLVAVELYKMLGKKAVEQKGADELLADPRGFVAPGKVKKKPALPDVGELEFDTSDFLENAAAQNYFAPNRCIPKSERSKWRFVVKRLYRGWCLAGTQPENVESAAQALEGLYKILCRGNEVYLFPSTEPFRAIGVPQHEFLGHVLLLKAQLSPPDIWIAQALALLGETGWNKECFVEELHGALLALFKTAELKECAQRLISNELARRRSQPGRPGSGGSWDQERRHDHLLRLGFETIWALGEKERALQWLRSHAVGGEKGDSLVLRLLLETRDREFWMREYGAACSRWPTIAAAWGKTYERAQSEGQLPAYQVY